MKIQGFFSQEVELINNLIVLKENSEFENQKYTNKIFSNKWLIIDEQKGISRIENFQKRWYLDLYGFKDEKDLQNFLQSKKIILDAGCGMGYKTAWFATLAPESIVIGIDFSDAVFPASKNYKHISNLFFIKGDIADTKIKKNTIDYISCDQVLHHTEYPDKTFEHLSNVLKKEGQFSCYVYAKKALPRELLDEHFREYCKVVSKDDLWKMSESLTKLGKILSDLKININVPDIPLLGIKGGDYDLQRFIYWNFLKCFWNEEFGYKNSVATNYDWYAPSNAKRYSEEEFLSLININHLKINYFHKEEACFSGRFIK